MSQFIIPENIVSVLAGLEAAGHSAYLVGGSVRDMLLGIPIHDWDVCTSALPEEVEAAFPDTRPTGLHHGTITVKSGGACVEVTSFRTESAYTDHRRPDSVRFITDVEGDLARRDFTMNAIAMSRDCKITDPFGGREDIARRIVRCVGDPDARFGEDALRMLRAVRFSAKLGFSLHPETDAAIRKSSPLAASLAPERICSELEAALLTGRPGRAAGFFSYGLLDAYIDTPSPTVELSALGTLASTRYARWSGLCAVLQREGIVDTNAFMTALRCPKSLTAAVSAGVSAALSSPPENPAGWKRFLSAHGITAALCLADACSIICAGSHARDLSDVLESGECFTLTDLAVSGKDLVAMGLSGPAVGSALASLLEHVIENPGDNDRQTLLAIIKQNYNK